MQSQVGTVVPGGSSGSQVQEAAPQGRDDVETMAGTGLTCEVRSAASLLGILGASGTEQVGLVE